MRPCRPRGSRKVIVAFDDAKAESCVQRRRRAGQSTSVTFVPIAADHDGVALEEGYNPRYGRGGGGAWWNTLKQTKRQLDPRSQAFLVTSGFQGVSGWCALQDSNLR